jgi:hypothetical protein
MDRLAVHHWGIPLAVRLSAASSRIPPLSEVVDDAVPGLWARPAAAEPDELGSGSGRRGDRAVCRSGPKLSSMG